jgi:predicted GNAT family acetyltransferase
MQFSAPIYKIGINPVVDVPERISRTYGRKGYVPVQVKIGGTAFRANLVPVGGGRHRLFLNLPMRQATGRDVGDRIKVALELDTASRVLRTPADLSRALRSVGKLRELAALPPSHRKEIIRWVTGTKNRETRARRIAKVMAEFPHTPYRKQSIMPEPITVQHNPGANRFEVVLDGHLSVCEYERVGNNLVFTHTLVPPELRGQGIAEQLARAALADARATGRRVVPACSYVAKFIERHREFQDLVAP